MNHPKLKWIKHTDYIPQEYLPTFSSHVIELNLHRIQDLSENFVYFNDEVFLIKETKPEDFFKKDLPCDRPVLNILYPVGFFSHIVFNNAELINRNFRLNKSIRSNKLKWIKCQNIKGFLRLLLYGRMRAVADIISNHIQLSFKKSVFETVWEKEYDCLHYTCQNRFRTKDDVSAWCLREWQLLSGIFYPHIPIGKYYAVSELSGTDRAIEYLKKQKGKVICLNDSENETDFEKHKQMIIEAFEKILPEKSSFEL